MEGRIAAGREPLFYTEYHFVSACAGLLDGLGFSFAGLLKQE